MVEACDLPERKNRFLEFTLLITTFFLVYSPVIEVKGAIIKFYQFPMIVMVGFWLLNCIKKKRVNKHELMVLIFFLLALGYSLVVVALAGWRDTEVIEYLIYGVLLSLAASMMVTIYKDNYICYRETILLHIYLVGIIHACIMLSVFFSEAARNFVFEYVVLSEKGQAFVETGSRSPGLTVGGGAALSVAQSATLVCGLFTLNSRKSVLKYWGLFKHSAGILLIVISILLSGRSGIVALIIFTFVLGYFYLAGNKCAKRYFQQGLILFISIVVVAFIAIFSFGTEYLDRNLDWVLELYINYTETGQVSTKSTDIILSEMYFLPQKTLDILFGTSNFGRGDTLAYIPSDVGYVRMIYAVGFVGTVMLLLPFIYLFVQAIKMRAYKYGILLIGLTIVQFVMNFKELFLVLVQGWTFIYFMVAWSLFSKRKEYFKYGVSRKSIHFNRSSKASSW